MPSLLEELIVASFPDGVARPAEEDWRAFVEHVAETLDIGPGTSVFDVACGAGAFLYPLSENNYVVGGVDPAAGHIARARAAMPNGRFEIGSVDAIDPAEPWDVVVAWRVLVEGDRDRARGLLARMIGKATHAIALLDIPETMDRAWLLRAIAEIGVNGVRLEEATPLDGRPDCHAFVKV
jgi:trans-aconitate methyltransferase